MSETRFDDRVAIVTGAGSGLGREYAFALAARGASVVVNDLGTDDLDDEQIQSIMDLHLMAGFYVGQPAYRAMKDQGYGRIVPTSSSSGLLGCEWQANDAAKTGLVGLVNVLALEGARHGICANRLLPCGASHLGQSAKEWPPVSPPEHPRRSMLPPVCTMSSFPSSRRLEPRWPTEEPE